MADHSQMKLGKLAARRDSRTLRLARYLTLALPPAPAQVDWSKPVGTWGLHLNDSLGCCTIAAAANAIQTWAANVGPEQIIADADVLKYYEQWDGYDPTNPATDQGGVELDVLNNWRQQGFDGVSLDAFAAINWGGLPELPVIPPQHVAYAIWLFGGAYIGVELPITARTQDVWEVPADSADDADSQPGSWGGHAVYVVAYDQQGLTCVTWGQLKKMTWLWFKKYCTEAYALISKDWIEASGHAPSGFDLPTLERDLAAVTA
jgi:hypothetical protein